jgi:hypothetical protein
MWPDTFVIMVIGTPNDADHGLRSMIAGKEWGANEEGAKQRARLLAEKPGPLSTAPTTRSRGRAGAAVWAGVDAIRPGADTKVRPDHLSEI